ncbi:glycosyltransferase family 71 protein [Myriangium duriaei CBS 260.36]|uniref:Glycosyltransferase family 71 protein n=1 Tax=Myriangium duriaei CBS 260.36 TaxID=1168546 RepID=A0A9P4JB50_9PEZI|nr:glycosyltransferase family 71 protein [Myriangium duriaei CBS 260.36]
MIGRPIVPFWNTSSTRVSLLLGLVFAAIYFHKIQIHDGWDIETDTSSREIFNASSIPLNFSASDWSQRGLQVKSLAKWGDHFLKHDRSNKTQFLDAIVQRYEFLEDSLTEDKIPNPWTKPFRNANDTGIVISLGTKQLRLAAHLIANLRKVLGSKLPIEIAYAGEDDLKKEEMTWLTAMGDNVKFLDLADIFPNARDDLIKGGWATKPFALLAASHPRTILVDADTIFLQKPDMLFNETPGLVDTGALFFHDRVIQGDTKRQAFMMKQFNAVKEKPSRYLDFDSLYWQGKTRQEADSGLVAMDKSRPSVFMGLVFACWLNTKAVRQAVTYKNFHGDKETFWIAMELSKAPYTFPPWYAGQIGGTSYWSVPEPGKAKEEERKEPQICSTHMLHMDLVRKDPFWFNGGIYEYKETPSRGYSELTHWWMQQGSDRTSAPRWRWVKGRACVSEPGMKPLDDRYKHVISRIIQEATYIDESFAIKFEKKHRE